MPTIDIKYFEALFGKGLPDYQRRLLEAFGARPFERAVICLPRRHGMSFMRQALSSNINWWRTNMKRFLTDHRAVENDRQPVVEAMGEIGVGGAEQMYRITYPGGVPCPTKLALPFVSLTESGVTNECLLAIVIDRLRGFQAGEFACEENAVALAKAEESLAALLDRTKKRMARGVEGKAEV